jgi:hypothetical protein
MVFVTRLLNFVRFGVAGILLGAALPVHAAPVARTSLFVHPTAADFDGDGRLDIAGAFPVRPNVVKVTLSRLGIYELTDVADIASVAALDYDHDGDTDIVVRTLQGFSIWVNDGAGRFSVLPCGRVRTPLRPTASSWANRTASSSEIATSDRLCAQAGHLDVWRLTAIAPAALPSEHVAPRSTLESAQPRAPPTSL